MNNSIHPSAIVDTKDIGKNSKIWAFVHILNNVHIGENVNICDHCFIEQNVSIGNNVTIKCGVWIWDGVIIEDDVFIGPNVTFTNDIYPRSKNIHFEKKQTILKMGSSIGANATLLSGIEIGAYSMVGAGSVVTKNVSDYSMVYGNPATFKGHICKCGKKLKMVDQISQCICGLQYKTGQNNNIILI